MGQRHAEVGVAAAANSTLSVPHESWSRSQDLESKKEAEVEAESELESKASA